MLVKITSLLFCFLVTNAFASSDAPKIAHFGSPHHDAIVRHLTENKAIVFAKPGAKGLIAFQALENKEVDFVILPSSTLYITPIKDPEAFKFDPLKKFKVLGVIAELESGYYLSPKHKSLAELKNKNGPIMHASGGSEAEMIIEETFNGKEVVHVNYRGIGQQLIDVKSGIADITFVPLTFASSSDLKPIPSTRSIKLHFVTRHDISDSQIKEFKKLINRNINSSKVKEFSTATKTKFILLKDRE